MNQPDLSRLRQRKIRPVTSSRAAIALFTLVAGNAARCADPIITEFLASNTATLVDQDQAYSDWIELHNPDATPVNLSGWYLTDSATNKTRWQFPAVTIAPGGYLVVFASSKNRRDPAAELHTNFALANEGEYLGLIKPDGVTAASEFAPSFPAQSNDVSYGLLAQPGGGLASAYFPTPTPGAPNISTGNATLAATIGFSRPPGPFSAPFALELSGAGPGQHIRYVTVPSSIAGATAPEPSESSPRYLGPLAIDAPALVRAAVFSDDLKSRGLSKAAMYFRLDLTGQRNLAAFATKLPVLVIEQHGFGDLSKTDQYQPAWLFGYAPSTPAGGLPFNAVPEFASPIRVAVRGSSSANFPKSSYTLEIVNDAGKDTARSLFGSRAFDEWALVGPWFYDPSFLRNAFIYALSNRLGRWAAHTEFVEVFVNPRGAPLDAAAYVGVYALTDKIEIHANRLAIDRLAAGAVKEPEITGGYLLKIDYPDATEYAWKTERWPDYDSFSSVIV
ncbi:MAG: CotH kinase family protein, partial [Phycisphaerales bacterium]|nr:CotH kinase family protein [Phycisphaerales bacterium]